nr:hypothetical protein [Tanacetum cinerariifolium]
MQLEQLQPKHGKRQMMNSLKKRMLNKDISTETYVQLYTYLKEYEPHAMRTLKKQEKSSSSVDPLAYLAHSVQHQISTYGAPQSSSSSSTPAPQQLTSSSREDAMMATMDKIVNLLSGFQKQFPQ